MFAGPTRCSADPQPRAINCWRDGRRGPIDVTSPRRLSPPPPIRPHRRSLPHDERTILRSIPITTTGRTILDCAALGATPETWSACSTRRSCGASRSAHPSATSSPGIRSTEGWPRSGKPPQPSHLTAPSPSPSWRSATSPSSTGTGSRAQISNHPLDTRIGRVVVDCAWPGLRYAVELDAPSTPRRAARRCSPTAARDRALRALGWRVESPHGGGPRSTSAALLADLTLALAA